MTTTITTAMTIVSATRVPTACHREGAPTLGSGGCARERRNRRRPARGGSTDGDGGYTVLEAAIVLPVMIVLTMLVIQYALWWHAQHVVEAAAQDGLRAARSYQSTPAAGQAAARQYLRQVAPRLLQRPQVSVSSTPATLTVSVRADVLPLLAFGRLQVQAAASGPLEQFSGPTR